MNYWLLTTEYPPFHGGGISTYCYFTARLLAGKGYSVTVFTQDDSIPDYIVSAEAAGISLVRFNSNRNKLDGFLGYTARLSYAFADMVRIMTEEKGKPACIEAQDYQGIAYYLTQFKHLGYDFVQGIPIIITLHSPAFIYLEYNRVPVWRFPDFWTCEMEKQSLVAADLLISPTAFLVEEIVKYVDIRDQTVKILPNPYQDNASPSLPSPHTGPGNAIQPPFTRNKIVYYGKLSPQKGSFELLAYFKELWDEGFPHPLHIIGGTDIVFHPEKRTMGQLIEKKYEACIKKGLLRLHGKIRPSQIETYLQDAHVIIVPSIVDNLPYVVMEAMSMGKIVLVSRQGGQREMVEPGISGFIFDHEEPGSFRRELEKILSLSSEAITEIGIRARERVARLYSFESIGPAKIALLERIQPLAANHFPFASQEQRMDGETQSPGKAGLLSVVIPYYNMGLYIEECIHSVLQSTYKQLEILLLNDGSTDPFSLEQLEKLGRTPGVRILHRKNQGLAFTRNAGAAAARGEFLAFLDADDKVAGTYFEKAIKALKKNDNVFFAGSWVQYFENSTNIFPCFTPQPPYVLVHNPVNSSGLVYKRDAFLAGGLNDKTVDYGLEDYESVVNMLHHGYNGVVLPEVLFYYRVRTGSMIRNITEEKWLYSYKYIADKHADYYAKFAPQVVNLLNANGPGYKFENPTLPANPLFYRKLLKRPISFMKNFANKNPRIKRLALALFRLRS